jgi:hypothetical protein
MRIEPCGEASLDGFSVRIRRQSDHRYLAAVIGLERPDFANDTESIFPGHGQIAEHDIGMVRRESVEALLRALSRLHLCPKGLQQRRHRVARVLLIVDAQYSNAVQVGGLFSRSGHVIVRFRSLANFRRKGGQAARQHHSKDGALSLPSALGRHGPLVHLDEIPRDGEAQAQAAEGAFR